MCDSSSNSINIPLKNVELIFPSGEGDVLTYIPKWRRKISQLKKNIPTRSCNELNNSVIVHLVYKQVLDYYKRGNISLP